jgi:3-oxoacyl-[acyl-carrier-protein] synthase II
MAERVAITGLGVVSPIGIGAAAFAAALWQGRSGIRRIRAFETAGLEVRIAGEVDAADELDRWVHPPKQVKLMSRAALFAAAAAAMARDHAALAPGLVDPERVGVCLGAGGMGPTDLDLLENQAAAIIAAARQNGGDSFDIPAFAEAFRPRTNPVATLRGLPNLAAAHVAIQQDARGPSLTISTACSAGTQAIGEALRMIQRGDADLVFAGGADAGVNPVALLGFSLLGTLSCRNDEAERASRPFDRDRDGFVIGEGAGIVVLERETLARARGARVLAELAGYGATCDAYRITDERPDASGATRAMTRCLADSGAAPGDVGYINAHGTGTRMNDLVETRAIRKAFGGAADGVAVSSTKSMTGHLLAAAGAVELIAAVLALGANLVPPTINLDRPDPECDLDYVPNAARRVSLSAALSNSFGFGGQNACLLTRRW